MSPLHPHSGVQASDHFNDPIALPRASDLIERPYETIAGKMTRFLARNVPIKKLPMHNAQPLVSFTFDDVPASACTAGALLLEQHQARGTFYISGGLCGASSPSGRLATADQVQALFDRGHEIGCHTYSHLHVVSVDRDTLDRDLDRNQSFLQGVLGDVPVSNFAYPYGDISFKAKRHLGARFDSCRAVTPGVNAGVTDLAVLKCCPLEQSLIDRPTITRFIAEVVRRNGWLLFSSHDVTDTPSDYGVRPDLLIFALRSALAAGCHVVTVAHALRLSRGANPNGQAV